MNARTPLAGKKIAVLVGTDYEDLEVWYPVLRLREAGADVPIAGQEAGVVYAGKHGYPCKSSHRIDALKAADLAGIVVPGGWMPDKLRRDPALLGLIRALHEQGKLIAAVCHGGWIPISAGVYRGVKVTGSPGIKDDLVNAGAIWEDAPLVVDRHFVCSRKPDDLPDFCRGILEWFTAK
ncbi:MAG TPA: type 1 glutamine amidotransferase domain-containing protein [Planctomycetia bacterium]|nr:type 1 glutamine amidotransferase domain-containing protein [Planctomycetia bacterium]